MTLADELAAAAGDRFAPAKKRRTVSTKATDQATRMITKASMQRVLAERSAGLIRGNAVAIPLRDASVDLVVTSPPYFALRSYQDGGEHYDGQIDSEPTPADFLAALWAVMDECSRVLKPSGSVWVNLGDKFVDRVGGDVRRKSRMMLPAKFAEGCIDPEYRRWVERSDRQCPQWILRAEVVWDKPNGLPEPVTDRVRISHEWWFHLVKSERYFANIDEIREPYLAPHATRTLGNVDPGRGDHGTPMKRLDASSTMNPLGKLPGSVWEVATEPLRTPAMMALRSWVDMAPVWFDREADALAYCETNGIDRSPWPRGEGDGPIVLDAPDHFAAFPSEFPRRIILGWSPPGVCTACGDGRRAATKIERVGGRIRSKADTPALGIDQKPTEFMAPGALSNYRTAATITGYRCACPDTSAPTRPAVVLDPFSGTGTTAAVAKALGRFGVGLDLSADYLRLARWRVNESALSERAFERTFSSGMSKSARTKGGQ